MKQLILLATATFILFGIYGLVGLKKENRELKVISEPKLMTWSVLFLVLALVNIVYLLYSYFSEIEN